MFFYNNNKRYLEGFRDITNFFVTFREGDIGGYPILQYRNTARKIGKYQNTMLKIKEILIAHLDPFIIDDAYIRLHPSTG